MAYAYVEVSYHFGMVNNVYHALSPTILISHPRLVRDVRVDTITMDIVVCLPIVQSHTHLIYIICAVCVPGIHPNKQMGHVCHVLKVKSTITTLSNAKDAQLVQQYRVIPYSVYVVPHIKNSRLCRIVVNVHSIPQC